MTGSDERKGCGRCGFDGRDCGKRNCSWSVYIKTDFGGIGCSEGKIPVAGWTVDCC